MAVRLLRSVWLWPSLLMAAIGLHGISRPLLWQDELVTVSIVSRSTRQIISVLGSVDAVHGGYYLFMHRWVLVFGQSAASLRAPSALAMACAAGCVALIGQRLFGRTAGLLGGFAFALVPAITRFAQEIRSYAFVVLVAAVATLFLLRALERPTAVRWGAYAACVTALIVLNTVAMAIVAGHLAGILTSAQRARNWRLLLQFGSAVVLGVLPTARLIYLGVHQAGRQVIWIPHDPPWVVWPRTFASGGMAWAVTVLAILAVAHYRRRAAFAAAVALTPLIVVGLGSLGALSYFFSKYLLFVIPAWAVLAGAGLATLRWKAAPVAALAVLAALAIPGQLAMRDALSHSWYTYPDPRPSVPLAYKDAAKIIATGYRPGDAIVYQRSGYWWLMLDGGVSYYLPARVKPRDVFKSRSAAEANELNAGECSASVLCIGGEPRVWVVVRGRTQDPLSELTPDQSRSLRQFYDLVSVGHPSGITVGLMRRAR